MALYVLKKHYENRPEITSYIKSVSTFPVKDHNGRERLAIMPMGTTRLEEAQKFMTMKVANQFKKMYGLTRHRIVKINVNTNIHHKYTP